MKTFLFIFLAGYAVNCDDNYYVIRMPEPFKSKDFNVYWNVPTMQCKSKGIAFDNLFEDYGMIQNTNDTYRGDAIAILYDPGNFPALIKDSSTGELKYRNGGVPQEGNLMDHLQNFKKDVENSIPDENFSGIGIIDFESWRPILRQNFGSLTPYKDVSYDIERKSHWWWKKQWIQDEAKRRFDASGREFMQTTLALAKKLRPQALWGYYGYPQCFNRPYNSRPEQCADDIPAENNKIQWLWSDSTALFPSVYSPKDVSTDRLAAFIRGRIKESERVRKKDTPILPYWWFRYRDGEYFKECDLETSFTTFYNSKASGFIIWGSSKDVNTKSKCINLKKYVSDILGPMVAKYTKCSRRFNDVPEENNPIVFKPEVVTEFDPEYHWEPPENYTSNIEHIVDEELKNKKESKPSTDDNILIDMILNRITNFCLTNCENNNDVKLEVPAVLTTKNPFEETTFRTTTTAKPTKETTVNHQSFSNDASDINRVTDIITIDTTGINAESTRMQTESIESATISVLENDLGTFDLSTSQNSIETNTENPGEIENIQNPIGTTTVNSEDTTNFGNPRSNFDEIRVHSLDYDATSTVHSKEEIGPIITSTPNYSLVSTNIPKFNLNDTSTTLINFDSVATNAYNLSSNDNSTENYGLESISTTDLSNTSPIDLSSTVAPSSATSRLRLFNWRDFYVDFLNMSNLAVNEFSTTTNANGVTGTTAAPKLADQVVISVV